VSLEDIFSIERIRAIDKGNMLQMIEGLPEDLIKSYEISEKLETPSRLRIRSYTIEYKSPNNVVVAGMGGSAIGGSIVSDLLRDRVEVPIVVSRQYTLPKFVNEKTLVIVVSYSGETEEVISSLMYALKSKSMVVCVSSNGTLARMCEKSGIPLVKVPQGYQPRAAIAYLTVPILTILETFKVVKFNLKAKIKEASSTLKSLRKEIAVNSPINKNKIKKLAHSLYRKIPIIYSYWPYSSAAFRFKTQLNENSKVLARYDVLPEMNHNEIMGWERISKKEASCYHVILLRGSEEPKEIKARVEFVRDMLNEKGVAVSQLTSRGSCRFAEIMSLIYQGDYTSYYLAILNEVDPTPVSTISRLKKYLTSKVGKMIELTKEFDELIQGSA